MIFAKRGIFREYPKMTLRRNSKPQGIFVNQFLQFEPFFRSKGNGVSELKRLFLSQQKQVRAVFYFFFFLRDGIFFSCVRDRQSAKKRNHKTRGL